MFSLALNYALARLKEPSTWNGFIVSAAGVAHISVSATLEQNVAAAGVAIAGAVAVFLKERGAV